MASEHSQLPGYSTTPEPSLVFAEGQLEKHPLRGILRFGPYSHSLGVPARVRVALLCPEGQSAKLEGVCRGNFDRDVFAIQIGNVDRPAQRGSREADRNARCKSCPFALENLVRLHMHENIKVTGRSTTGPSLPLARKPNPRPGIDARRNFDGKRLRNVYAPFPAAVATGRGDDFTAAMAIGAWSLDHEKTLLGPNLSLPVAKVASSRASTWRGAGPVAGFAIL